MNSIDEKIKNIVSKKLEVPLSYQRMVRETLDTTHTTKQNVFIKIALPTCACLIVTTTIVFAKDFSNFIKYFFGHNKGMDIAIENGYIDNDSTDYVESNGIKVKIDRFLMDDYNMNLNFLIKISETIEKNKIQRINFSDMIINDENNNILFCQNRDTFIKYCEKYNLNYRWEEKNDKNINSGSNYYIKTNENNTINFIYNMYAPNFPKSKKIIVNFNEIVIYESEDIEKDGKTLTGSWKFEIDVPKQFYEREDLVYKVKNCSNKKMNITKAIVSETCTKFELQMEEPPDLPYDLNDDEETKERKIEEYIERQKQETIEDIKNKIKFKNEYIQNEKGEKFYPSRSTDQDGGYSNIEMKYLVYWQTFELTKIDATDKLKVFFNYKGEDVEVELEREEI